MVATVFCVLWRLVAHLDGKAQARARRPVNAPTRDGRPALACRADAAGGNFPHTIRFVWLWTCGDFSSFGKIRKMFSLVNKKPRLEQAKAAVYSNEKKPTTFDLFSKTGEKKTITGKRAKFSFSLPPNLTFTSLYIIPLN